MSELGESPLTAGDRQLSVAQARAAILQALVPVQGVESVPVTAAPRCRSMRAAVSFDSPMPSGYTA
jgi:hypothetical protein